MALTKEEYFARASERAPMLNEILTGYVAGRFDELREKLPLELFACPTSPDRPPVNERDRFMSDLCWLETELLVGGSGQSNVLAMTSTRHPHNDKSPTAQKIYREIPPVVAETAWKTYRGNPFFQAQPHPDFPQGSFIALSCWDGLAHPFLFRKNFTLLREFLEGMAEYLEGFSS